MSIFKKPTVISSDGRFAPAIIMASGHKVRGEFRFISYEDAEAEADTWFKRETATDMSLEPEVAEE